MGRKTGLVNELLDYIRYRLAVLHLHIFLLKRDSDFDFEFTICIYAQKNLSI